jgi:hypothetical protein
MVDMDDDELLDALGVEATPLKVSSRTPREERMIAGFEDILRFHQTHGRAPRHGEDGDIFERLYAVRLEQLRRLPEARTLLAGLDHAGLISGVLSGAATARAEVEDMDEDALLAELGVGVGADTDDATTQNDITVLRNVRSSSEKRAAEEIGQHKRCLDFETFKPLFTDIQNDLKSGVRIGRRFKEDAEINKGEFYILGGQIAYVADMAEQKQDEYGKWDARLRVIYSNGTESNILLRSLQKALYKDDAGRRVTEPDAGPLFTAAFAAESEEGDIESGTIYVLRSQSSHPYITEHRELIHKIGVTGGKVETRIAGADKDATYLLADVEVVATYKLHNLNRTKLENIFHRLFAAAQLDLTIADRFGNPVKPREWFLVPLHVINEAVERIRDGSIADMVYEPKLVRLVSRLHGFTMGQACRAH